jgi:hypothetical protein
LATAALELTRIGGIAFPKLVVVFHSYEALSFIDIIIYQLPATRKQQYAQEHQYASISSSYAFAENRYYFPNASK